MLLSERVIHSPDVKKMKNGCGCQRRACSGSPDHRQAGERAHAAPATRNDLAVVVVLWDQSLPHRLEAQGVPARSSDSLLAIPAGPAHGGRYSSALRR